MEAEITIFLEARAGQAPDWLCLLPAGEVTLGDGREPLVVDQEALADLVQHFHDRGLDLVIDYEHQTLSGGKAPAAGWIKELEARADGLWARVEWTAEARRFLAAREYRYFSPVLRLAAGRRPVALLHVALTNTPAINGLQPLVAKNRVQGPGVRDQQTGIIAQGLEGGQAEEPEPLETLPRYIKNLKETNLAELLERIKDALGLEAAAAGEDVLTQLEVYRQGAASFVETAGLLGLPEDASASQVKGAVLALKSGLEQLRQWQAELAAMKTDLSEREAQEAVQSALEAGKIQPSQRDSALAYARTDIDGFKTFVEKSLPVMPFAELKFSREDAGPDDRGLTPPALTVCEAMGLPLEAFKAEARRLRTAGVI